MAWRNLVAVVEAFIIVVEAFIMEVEALFMATALTRVRVEVDFVVSWNYLFSFEMSFVLVVLYIYNDYAKSTKATVSI